MDGIDICLICSRDAYGYKEARKLYYATAMMRCLCDISNVVCIREQDTKEMVHQMIVRSDLIVIIENEKGEITDDLRSDLECATNLNRMYVLISPGVASIPEVFFKMMKRNILWALNKKKEEA